jgi:DNA repair exonuclease SbcCD ATPase subunit
MAFEPDRVVVELIAKTEQFDSKVKQSASTNESAMNKIVADAGRAEGAVTRSASGASSSFERETKKINQASKQMGQGFLDVGAIVNAPTSPFVTVPKQAPAVSSAMKGVTVAASALGGILGGVAAAGAALLIDKLLETAAGSQTAEERIAELVEKMKENAQRSRDSAEAGEIFERSLEGIAAAADDAEQAIEALRQRQESQEEQTVQSIQKSLDFATAIRDETKALLDAAEAYNERYNGSLASADPRFASEFQVSGDRIDALRKKLGLATESAGRLETSLLDALSLRTAKEAGGTAEQRLGVVYDKMVSNAEQAAAVRAKMLRLTGDLKGAERAVTTELQAQTKEIERQRAEALKKIRDAEKARNAKPPKETGQSGRQYSDALGRQIALGLGLPARAITSQTRTAEHNKRVGGQANSYHLTGQAIDIDKNLANAAGQTLTSIVRAFEKQGLRVIEKLDEGDHYHLALAKRGEKRGRAGPSAETLEKRRIAALDAEERREQAFQNEKAGLQADELELRQALIQSAEDIAAIELAAIEISRQKYADGVASLVKTRKLTGDEAKELLAINEERAKLRAEIVKRQERERQIGLREQAISQAESLQSARRSDAGEVLQSQLAIVQTRKERAAIERRLLELQFQEERAALQAIISRNERLKYEKDIAESVRIQAAADAAMAQIALNSIDQRQANATVANERANASPLESYFGDIQAQGNDINTMFEEIAAGGLATFVDSLTDAIVNFKSLGDVGRAVLQSVTASLVKLAIQQVLNATIGRTIASASAAAQAAQLAAIGAAAAGPAALVATATAGGASIAANAGLASTAALAQALAGPRLARGGRVVGSGTPTSDGVPLMGSVDEFMIRASSARKLGYDVLEHINDYGTLPGFSTGGRVRRVSPSNAAAASSFRGGFGSQDISALRGIIGEAVNAGVSAMPDVSLYASLDPVDVLQRALGAPAGEKAMVAAIGRNASKIGMTAR